MPPDIPILIPAAGSSTRMNGQDKLLMMVDGETLLHRQARLALETGSPVIVVLATGTPDRQTTLADLDVTIAIAPQSSDGMAGSILCGLMIARGRQGQKSGLMILPADMPDFTVSDLNTVLEVFAADPTRIVRGATETGQPGHPTVFPFDLWTDLAQITGDQGGRQVLLDHRNRVSTVALPRDMAITDLDTPGDWARWTAARSV